MPKYRFRWDAFDDQTVRDLANAIGFGSNQPDTNPRDWLTDKVARPNDEFIRQTLQTLLRTPWFRNSRELPLIVQQLRDRNIGPMSSAKSQDASADYIRACRNSSTLRSLLCEAMIRFGDGVSTVSTQAESQNNIPSFAVLIPENQPEDKREPHPYQGEAWHHLDARIAETQSTRDFRGLLVMPTGSGKTFTAVGWVITRVINRGGRVLWVAHRHELLEQAAEAFDRAIYRGIPRTKAFRRRIVSGKHCSTSQISPDDDILICSIASLARRPDIVEQVLCDHFLVIDEAHHAPAKSYRDLIDRVNSKADKRQGELSSAHPIIGGPLISSRAGPYDSPWYRPWNHGGELWLVPPSPSASTCVA